MYMVVNTLKVRSTRVFRGVEWCVRAAGAGITKVAFGSRVTKRRRSATYPEKNGRGRAAPLPRPPVSVVGNLIRQEGS